MGYGNDSHILLPYQHLIKCWQGFQELNKENINIAELDIFSAMLSISENHFIEFEALFS